MRLAPRLVEVLTAVVDRRKPQGRVVGLDGATVGGVRVPGPYLLAPE